MEEKQPVVIQGRTIHRERPSETRQELGDRSYYTGRAGMNSSQYSNVSLSGLRESRRAAGGTASLQGADRPHVRPRTGRSSSPYPGRLSAGDGLQLNSMMTKIAVSVLIALIILLLNSIKLPFAEAVIGQVRTALTHEFDLDETLGKLKFVGDLIPGDIKAVFGQNAEQKSGGEAESFRSPAQGEVVRAFGEQVILDAASGKGYENQGIDIKTEEQAPVYSTAAGTVAAVEQHETFGLSIWVDHGNKTFSFYGRLGKADVTAGQRVQQGERLGTVDTPPEGEPLLHFQIWKDDIPADPLDYIGQTSESFGQRGVQPA
jgi:murein DD-endopeptidase MepM/ murein hydrolase activator NlpD